MPIIALFFGKIWTFNIQIWFKFFICLFYLRYTPILLYNRFWLAIKRCREEGYGIIITLALNQKQVSSSFLPNKPFKNGCVYDGNVHQMSEDTGNNKSEWHLAPVESARVLSGCVFLFPREKDRASVRMNNLVSYGRNEETPVPIVRDRDDVWDRITACAVRNPNTLPEHLSTMYQSQTYFTFELMYTYTY